MIYSFVFFVLSLYLFLNAPMSMDKSFMTWCIVLALIEILFLFVHTRKKDPDKLKKIVLRPSYLFVLCFFIVFFQCDIDFILGIIDDSNNYLWINTRVVSKSLALSVLALSSLICGYFVIYGKPFKENKVIQNVYKANFPVGILTIVSYVIIVVYILFVPKQFLYGGYNEGAERGWANILLIILQAVLAAAFALVCYFYKGNRNLISFFKETKWLIVFSLIYMLLVLMSGRRTEAIRIGLMVLLSYGLICREKVSLKVLIVLFVAGSMAMSLTRVIRSGDSKNLRQGMELAMDETSFSPLTKELATSVNTLHVAVNYYPDAIPYNNGLSFFSGMLVIVPGLERLVSSYIPTDPLKSGAIITTLQGTSWGMGSSLVTDAYISFGPIGVIILFFILGFSLRYLDFTAFCTPKPSPFFMVVFFSFCSQFMFACRGTFGTLFLSMSYAIILMFIITRKNKAIKLNKRL